MRTRSAFSLAECVTLVAVFVAIACVLVPATAQTRSAMRLSSCSGLLRTLGIGMQSYTTDNANRFPVYSWRAGPSPAAPGSPVYGMYAYDLGGAALQARDIIWRRAGGFDIGEQGGWLPQISYNHLVLSDYMGWDLRSHPMICNDDLYRFRWLAARQQFANGTYSTAPVPEPMSSRWSFSSSFAFVPQVWSPDGGVNAAYQGGTQNAWYVPGQAQSEVTRRISEVRYPANKVFLYDSIARHMPERWYFYAWSESVQPLLFFDLSVRDKRTGAGNRGFNPSNPASFVWTNISYTPAGWEAPTVNGGTTENFPAYFRFTRSGLRGRDFDGPEVPWGQ